MPTPKTACPSCRRLEAVPVVYGDFEYLDEGARLQVERGGAVCGGDAIAIDESNHVLNWACLSCGYEWHAQIPKVLA